MIKADPAFMDALSQRGITDLDAVMVDIWSAGNFGTADTEGRVGQGVSPGTATGRRTTATPGRSRACSPSST